MPGAPIGCAIIANRDKKKSRKKPWQKPDTIRCAITEVSEMLTDTFFCHFFSPHHVHDIIDYTYTSGRGGEWSRKWTPKSSSNVSPNPPCRPVRSQLFSSMDVTRFLVLTAMHTRRVRGDVLAHMVTSVNFTPRSSTLAERMMDRPTSIFWRCWSLPYKT